MKKTKGFWKERLVDLIVTLVTFSVVYLGPKALGFNFLNINGESMAPTFHDNTFMVLKEKKPEAGEIIVFLADESWSEKEKFFIKRIVGKGGDELSLVDNKLYVDGKLVRDLTDYPISLEGRDFKMDIPEGKYFVVGDNTNFSNDSLHEFALGNPNFLVSDSQVKTIGDSVLSLNYKK